MLKMVGRHKKVPVWMTFEIELLTGNAALIVTHATSI